MEREKRNLGPHIGVIKFAIYVHKVLPDGSIDPYVIDCSDLFNEHQMSNAAEITVTGFDKWDCVRKIKEKMENLNGQ